MVAEGTPQQLKRQIPGGHVQLQFAEAVQLGAAARVLTGSTPDEESLILRVPSDGGVKSLRTLLDRLDEYAIDGEEFTVHLPDLDDVFLALTGHLRRRPWPNEHRHFIAADRFGDHVAPQLQAHHAGSGRAVQRDPVPIVMMFMFVYLLGDGFNVGGGDYIDYAAPGMIMLALCHGMGAIARTVVGMAAIVGGAFLMGFSPSATFPQWLAVAGILVLTVSAVTWLTIAFGLAAKTPESAGFFAVPLIMLPFFSSAIIPADRMGPGIRRFAECQPFTPIIETVRGLFNGTPSSGSTIAALAWSVGIAVVGYVWARSKFNKRA